jgi:hypothetical protein
MSEVSLEKDEKSISMTSTNLQILLTEYTALRDEIIKRQETRFQLVSLTLIIAGTIFSFGTKDDISVIVLLIYPILGFFLALISVHNQMSLAEISRYLKEKIEDKLLSMGWEKNIRQLQSNNPKNFFTRTKKIPVWGVFIVTEIVAFFLAIPRIDFKNAVDLIQELLLLSIDIAAIILTTYIFRHRVGQ